MVQKARIINQQLSDDAFSDEVISLKAKVPVLVGNGALVKVNTGVGISTESNIQTEYKKAELLCSLHNKISKIDFRFCFEFGGESGTAYKKIFCNIFRRDSVRQMVLNIV